jgi:triosephosphate isomerase
MRRPIVAANWKMHGTPGQGVRLATGVAAQLEGWDGADVVLCPPFTSLAGVAAVLERTAIRLGAQDCHWERSGAFTGEVSVEMLAAAGCRYAIVGHSERRTLSGETDETVGRKATAVIESGVIPILCVGETLEQREAGETEAVLDRQLERGLAGLGDDVGTLVLAYEPVWAIGTGRTASAEIAQQAHGHIRKRVAGLAGDAAASAVRIQYGGSVKPANAAELFAQPDVDGGLIGGASLSAESFAAIVAGCRQEAGEQDVPVVELPPDTPARVHVNDDSDAEAIALAQQVMERMGGWEAWDATRYVSWHFFGRRMHYWDRETGDIRIEFENEGETYLILMNVADRSGRAWKNSEPLEEAELTEMLESGHAMWVNDSYWMFMPYKLLDPGVTLKYVGEKAMADGRGARVVELTFSDGTGLTPGNKYEVYVADDTTLVEQWDFYLEATDPEPRFASPWTGWQEFGGIWLATDHGRQLDWRIAVHEQLSPQVFSSPDPVELEPAG